MLAAVAGGAAPTPPRRGDISSSRFGIWSNTLALIAQQPLRGVGFGEFNLAWTLTEFPGRPVAFFDHVHNLPLHLAVEMGLPLALATLGLLGWALWRAGRRVWQPQGDAGIAARSAWNRRGTLALVVLSIALATMLLLSLERMRADVRESFSQSVSGTDLIVGDNGGFGYTTDATTGVAVLTSAQTSDTSAATGGGGGPKPAAKASRLPNLRLVNCCAQPRTSIAGSGSAPPASTKRRGP